MSASAPTTAPAPAPPPIATLHPAWGATLMSLGGAALISLRDPIPGSGVDEVLGLALLAAATAVGVVLTVAGLVRMIAHRQAFAGDLAHPGMGAMVASWPAGLQILALAILQAGVIGALPSDVALVGGLSVFVPGLAGTLAAGYAFYTRIIGLADVPHAAVSGQWFIPVVPLVLTPSILFRAVELGLGGDPRLWAFLAVLGWGVGFTLFLLLASIVGSRLLVAPPPAAQQAPAWWAWLAPLGAGGMGLVATTRMVGDAGVLAGIDGVSALIVTAMWGFSMWWLLLAVRVIAKERRDLRFHLGWWGFGFPTAAFVGLTGEVAHVWGFAWLAAAIPVLWVGLLIVVAALAVMTIGAMRSGAAWRR
ncbi:hypothetical protein P0L94_00435 [Microbacter sp. GSS18]|nr:hypothetical protein P0L94_00435 [Microbacter sp. GSS18]